MKSKVTIRQVCSHVLALILVLSLAVNTGRINVAAAGTENRGMDIAIIIDTSGSMRQTDSERIAIEAAKLFIDMMETSGSRVGVVSFSDSLGTVIDMTEINSQADKESIKRDIENLIYAGDTDIGLALQKGYDILQNAYASDNQKVILFFTDGRIDLPNSIGRTDQDSMNDSLHVASLAASMGIPIYSIGLNSNGNVDRELIATLSDDTDGRQYIVDSAEKLPEIFDEIFADFINSNIISLGDFETDGVNYTEIPFNMPNNSVLEANLIMLSDVPLEDVQIYAPDGTDKMLDSAHAIWEESAKYSLLKLITPEMGDWILRIKGQEGCKVHVNLIFNYHVNLLCDAQIVSDASGRYLDVTAWMEKEGSKLTDADLYHAFEAMVFVDGPSGIQRYGMSVGEDSFHVSIPADDMRGEIKVYTRIESESMYRESEIVILEIMNNAPIISNIPDTLELNGMIAAFGGEKFIIADCVKDPDGDEVSVTVEVETGAEKVVSANVGAKEITITPGNNGNATITITVTDSNGAEVSQKVLVAVDYKMRNILPIILLLLFMVVVIVVLLKLKAYLKVSNSPFYGVIRWSRIEQRGVIDAHRLDYEKGSLSLGSVIIMPETAEFDLNKVKIHMNKSMDGILIQNGSKKCSMAMGYGAGDMKQTEIRSGEFVILTGQYIGNVVSLKVEYHLS